MDNELNKYEYKPINKSLYGGSSLFSKSKSPYECDTTYCSNMENSSSSIRPTLALR